MALLKKETGIEVKSASSSVEEIVARQFVEKQARARKIQLPPPSKMFEEAPTTAKKAVGKTGGKAPEPPKPVAPVLRPRLIKTVKHAADHPADQFDDAQGHDEHHEANDAHDAAHHVDDAHSDDQTADAAYVAEAPEPQEAAAPVEVEPVDEAPAAEAAPEAAPEAEPAPEPEPAPAPAPAPVTPPPAPRMAPRIGGLRVETSPPPPLKPRITEVPVQRAPATPPLPRTPAPVAAKAPSAPTLRTPAPKAPAPAPPAPVLRAPAPPVPPAVPPPPPRASRIVPPTRRLRIEDPVTGEAPAARPTPPRPILRAPVPPTTPRPPQAATGNLARPGGPGGMRTPSGPSARPPRPRTAAHCSYGANSAPSRSLAGRRAAQRSTGHEPPNRGSTGRWRRQRSRR